MANGMNLLKEGVEKRYVIDGRGLIASKMRAIWDYHKSFVFLWISSLR